MNDTILLFGFFSFHHLRTTSTPVDTFAHILGFQSLRCVPSVASSHRSSFVNSRPTRQESAVIGQYRVHWLYPYESTNSFWLYWKTFVTSSWEEMKVESLSTVDPVGKKYSFPVRFSIDSEWVYCILFCNVMTWNSDEFFYYFRRSAHYFRNYRGTHRLFLYHLYTREKIP